MRDEDTGSWWQQISGKAIQGPQKGAQLTQVPMDEVSFDIWRRENPQGRVLRPDDRIVAENKYASADWEAQVAKMRVTTSAKLDERLEPRAIVVGVTADGVSKAYPMTALEKQNPIIDTLGSKEIIVLVADDHLSVRVFDRTVDGRTLQLFAKPGTTELIDAETGSTWDFSGTATAGELRGKQLAKLQSLKDYWFDWKTYHPDTLLYTLGGL